MSRYASPNSTPVWGGSVGWTVKNGTNRNVVPTFLYKFRLLAPFGHNTQRDRQSDQNRPPMLKHQRTKRIQVAHSDRLLRPHFSGSHLRDTRPIGRPISLLRPRLTVFQFVVVEMAETSRWNKWWRVERRTFWCCSETAAINETTKSERFSSRAQIYT